MPSTNDNDLEDHIGDLRVAEDYALSLAEDVEDPERVKELLAEADACAKKREVLEERLRQSPE